MFHSGEKKVWDELFLSKFLLSRVFWRMDFHYFDLTLKGAIYL